MNQSNDISSNNRSIEKVYILMILVIVSLECIAHYHIKKSKVSNRFLFMSIAILCYVVICLLLNKCYDFNGIGITNFAWSILSIISVLLVGHLVFSENITKYDIIGLVICIIGLYFIFIHEHNK
jgi:multidrug transporter EmrE-like cation transporter